VDREHVITMTTIDEVHENMVNIVQDKLWGYIGHTRCKMSRQGHVVNNPCQNTFYVY